MAEVKPWLDINKKVGALLRDLADVQTSQQSKWGYKRAAAAILDLEEPLESLLQPDGTLRKIPHVGPSSLRVIHEFLQSGRSESVERAVTGSPKAATVGRSREWRGNFLSGAQVAEVLGFQKNRGLGVRDYRGDLQMHSTYSDGRVTLAELAEGCLARGYAYCGVTDHSYGLPIARGVSMSNLARQHAEINRLNRRYKGRFRMLKGIEANILADGTLDMAPDELRTLEVILAAPHSKLRTGDDQTTRMLTAVSTPGVHILAHPRGRKFGTRPGIAARWDRVFAAAAASGVAIEIDGDPTRQDVDFELAQRAIKAGCLFALDSDAHSVEELRYADIALAHARLAGIPKARIVNCWELDRLREWLDAAWSR
ncbi:MAG TPA: PHP domain-containing protein [Vicinamibacterales bacterium]|nr:PHP domain-containing protein [Vicinamibacterales bacterium]